MKFHCLISRRISGDDTRIKPKKNDQMEIGFRSSSNVMTFDKVNRLVTMPARMQTRKFPFIFFQHAFNWNEPSSCRALRSMARIEKISSS